MKNLKVLNFPVKKRKVRKPVNLDGVKYFTEKEIKLLRRTARDDSELALKKDKVTAVRAWMAIDILTCTGLRVSECADLRYGNLKISHGKAEIFVRDGKGCISGTVIIPLSLKKHLHDFLRFKETNGEGISQDDYLFIGQRGKWTSQAIQQIVKGYLKKLSLYEKGKSVHALRHSYAVELYKKERDLRTVQKQLRHVSVQSTTIYADVSKDEIEDQIKGLWN